MTNATYDKNSNMPVLASVATGWIVGGVTALALGLPEAFVGFSGISGLAIGLYTQYLLGVRAQRAEGLEGKVGDGK